MTSNLFVSFDLRDPYRQSPLILSAIEELGQATRLFCSTWYVRSSLSASEAARRVWDVMDRADTLLVIDATRDEVAMFNLNEYCVRFMSRCWHLAISELEPMDSSSTTDEALPLREIRSATG